MAQQQLLKPALYAAGGSAAAPGHPALKGGRCTCGYVFFPFQSYGCEKCGRHGADLQPVDLTGRGRLIASATVHMHAAKNRPTPFTIVSVKLEDGPVVRTLLAEGETGDLVPGQAMVTVLVPAGDGKTGEPRLDLRFRRAP